MIIALTIQIILKKGWRVSERNRYIEKNLRLFENFFPIYPSMLKYSQDLKNINQRSKEEIFLKRNLITNYVDVKF